MIVLEPHGRSSKEVPVRIVGGSDVRRRQITFDWVDRATGQAQRGQITPATAEVLGRWLAQLPGHHGAFAVEACTGWRFVVQALQAAGCHAYLAEPAETASLGGPKRRAKTDRSDAQLLRELLEQHRLPQAWIPPAQLLELRVLVRLRKTLVDERTAFKQRLHAVLFHHGCPAPTMPCCRGRPAAGCNGWRCRRPAACRWRPRCGRSTSSTWNWTRWSAGGAPSPAVSPAAGR
jgi:hypothetical protein